MCAHAYSTWVPLISVNHFRCNLHLSSGFIKWIQARTKPPLWQTALLYRASELTYTAVVLALSKLAKELMLNKNGIANSATTSPILCQSSGVQSEFSTGQPPHCRNKSTTGSRLRLSWESAGHNTTRAIYTCFNSDPAPTKIDILHCTSGLRFTLSGKRQLSLKLQTNLYIKKRWSYPCNRPWRPIGMWHVEAPTFSRQSAQAWRWGCQPYAPAALSPPGRFLVLISVRVWVDSRAIVRLEGLGPSKNPTTSSGI
jgi:hypothetical protein